MEFFLNMQKKKNKKKKKPKKSGSLEKSEKYSECTVTDSPFKLQIKTVKMLFGSINQELLGLS